MPAPGHNTPMHGTAAIARTFGNLAWLSTITQLIGCIGALDANKHHTADAPI